jgi:hypothetical protein
MQLFRHLRLGLLGFMVAALFFVNPALTQAASTNFDSFAVNTTAENLTVPGVTFSSNPAGVWTIKSSFFVNLTGNVLIEYTSVGVLTVTFAQPQDNVQFNFATVSTNSVNVAGFVGAQQVLTQSFSGTIPGGGIYREGSASVSFSGLTSIQISSSNVIAIDNLNTTPSPTITKFAVSGFPSPTKVGNTGSFTVTAQDKNSNTVTGYTGTVNLTSSDSQIAGLPASYTFTAGDNGTHTFTGVSFKTVGSQSLTATDSGNASITGSQTNIQVNPNIPPTLSVSPTTLNFTAQAGGADPASQSLTISNIDGASGPLNWNLGAITYNGGAANWLNCTPPSGSNLAPGANTTVNCSATTGTLAAGNYSATFEVIASNPPTFLPAGVAGSPQLITVNFKVTAAPPSGKPGYASDPKPGQTLSMNGRYGNAARKGLLVSEVGEADLVVSDPKITGENASEFSIVSPAFPLTIADGSPAQEIVVKCSAAEPGKRKALLTLSTNDPTQPTVSYYLLCGAEEEKKPADLVVQLRVTPDRTAKNDPATEIKFELSIKNVGPGEGGAVRLMFPIDRNLVPAYTSFSDPQMWVSELVTEGENPYMKIAVPAMQPNQSYSATLVFHPKGGLKDGTLIREQFTAGWDDAVHAGMTSTSNAVTIKLSDEQGDRDDSKGTVMWFAQHGQKVALGHTITLTGDFYTPEEAVDFWYSDAAGNSVQLGKFWADKKGKISLEFSTTGLKEGQVYTIVGKGRRSGIMGSAAITVTAPDSGDGDQPKAPVEGLK